MQPEAEVDKCIGSTSSQERFRWLRRRADGSWACRASAQSVHVVCTIRPVQARKVNGLQRLRNAVDEDSSDSRWAEESGHVKSEPMCVARHPVKV